jgi:molybdopterin molybdotransferase
MSVRVGPAHLLEVEVAQERVLAEVAVGAAEQVSLLDAFDRVLREEIAVDRDAPPADNSAMDGYAVRAEDVATVPVTLRVTGDIPAGHPVETIVEPGTAMRIMTGAFVPAGADAVVQVEWTDGGLASVEVRKTVRVGQNVRRRGEDLRAGDVVLRSGMRIGAAETAMLAQAGRRTVAVGRQPEVAILATGDELVEPGAPLPPGAIVNTNSPLLAALVRSVGARPRVLGIVRDDRDATIAALRAALESDFVVTSGGVSVGAFDFVKEALDAIGAETRFWKVAMKPGKPIVLSRANHRVVFGLPGNPASCFVSFHLFVAPALRKAQGQSGDDVLPRHAVARASQELRSAGDRRTYLRVRVRHEGRELVADPLASQGSGSLSSMLGANALAVLAQGATSIPVGSDVPVLLL